MVQKYIHTYKYIYNCPVKYIYIYVYIYHGAVLLYGGKMLTLTKKLWNKVRKVECDYLRSIQVAEEEEK